MSRYARALRREDFQIAVICAVGCEYDAVALAFDEIWEGDGGQLGNAPGDNNKYKTGQIGGHNAVLLLLPGMGKVNAASAAASLRSSYTNIKLAILAGICGGVPGARTSKELLLGDVVISKSIVQYDLGRQHPGKFAPKDSAEDRLGRPSKDIRSLVAKFETRDGRDGLQRRASQALNQIQQKAMNAGHRELYNRPTATEDRLFEPGYLHRHRGSWNCGCSESGACKAASSASCEELQCDGSLVPRSRLNERKVQEHEGDALVAPELGVFVGCVGSGDTVMKSGLDRDRIAKDHGLIAFEMEGAGVWDEIPCIIVKAVCDYADSHKNKKWQDFAAARAASTTKALLDFYPNTDSPMARRTQFVSRHEENLDFPGRTVIAGRTDEEGHVHVQRQYEIHERELLELLAAEHDAYKNFNPRRIDGTCEWFFKDHRYHEWLESTTSSIIWVSAGPGCGKSVLARSLVDQMLQSANSATTTICYFFFKDGEERRTDSHDALSAVLHQLFTQNSANSLIRQAAASYQNYGKRLRNNFHQLWQILTACVGETDAGEVVCVLDALDECSQRGREEILEALQTFYFDNRTHPSSRLKFLVTSRPYDDLDMSFSKFKKSSAAEIYIRFDGDDKSEEIRHEIDLVIDHKVDEFAEDFGTVDRQKISKRLKAMDNRTYLWLCLTLDIIYHNRSAYSRASDIEDLLSQLPSGIFDAYEKILSRSQNKKRARCLLQIIIAATRPLTLDEVNCSLVLQEQEFKNYDSLKSRLWRPDNFKRTVKNLCGLFVSVYDNKVSLMHQTAREFLTSPELQNVWQGSIDVPLAHSTIFLSCVRLLSLKDINMTAQSTSGGKALSFMSYAAENWTLHYNSQDGSKRDALCEKARELCRISKGHIPIWVEVWKADFGLPWSYLFYWTDLTLASYFGLLEVAVHIVSREDVDINSQGGYFGTAVKAAAAQGHSDLVQTLLRRGANCDTGGGPFRTALLAAASKGHLSTVRCLLNSGAKVTQEVVMAGANCNEAGAKEVMALLLDNCGDEAEITPELVVTMARNYKSGKEMMQMLVEKYGDKAEISQDAVIAAARLSTEVMAFLLDKHEDRVDVTEKLVMAVARKQKEAMVLLLEKCGDKVIITQNVLKAAAENVLYGDEMMGLLLEKGGDKVEITEEVLKAVVENAVSGKETMDLLLKERRDEVEITEDVLWSAARNDEMGDNIMALLLEECGDQFDITPRVVEGAVSSWHCGKETLELLLERRGDEIEITAEILEAVVRNDVCGNEMMDLLLEKRRDEVKITQELLLAAAKEGSGDTMILLLERYRDIVEITPEVVMAAAGNYWNGNEVMTLLLEKYGDKVETTPEVVVAVAGTSQAEATISLLLAKRGSEVKVTQEAVIVGAGNRHGREIMDLLLAIRGDEIQMTQEVVVAAAGNIDGGRTLAFLLEARGDEIQITPEVIAAAEGNRYCRTEIMALLRGKVGGTS